MKNLLSAIMLLFCFTAFSQETLILDKVKVYDWGGTVTAGLFKSNNNAGLPLVIYAHGKGESVMTGSMFSALRSGARPSFPCIIIGPQQSSWSPYPSWIQWIIKDAYARFAIDTTRIYLTGLSAGGDLVYGGVLDVDSNTAKKIAAIAPLSPNTTNNNWNNISRFKSNKTPVWSIMGGATTSDNTEWSFRERNIERIVQINRLVPNLATYYVRKGIGHCCWADVYNGTVKDSTGKSIWDFFKDKKTGGVVIPPVLPPVITNPSPINTTVGDAFNATIVATNNPTSFAGTSLPEGLTVAPHGIIMGLPTTAGTFVSTITATNAGGTGSATVTFIIAPKPKTVSRTQTIIDYENPSCSIKITYYSDGTYLTEKL